MFGPPTRLGTLGRQAVLTALALLYAGPLLIAARVSLQGEGLGNYRAVLRHPLIPRYFLNSVIVTACTIVVVYVITVLAAYAFSKLQLRGKGLLYNAVLAGLTVPGIALVVPLFLLVKDLKLFDTYLAMIVPISAFTLPFTVLLMRNFLDGLPNELLDAARIDGSNSFTTLLWIVLPLSKPISIVVVVWTFLGAWNEYFLALVFLRDERMQVLTQAPQFFTDVYGQDTGKIFATLVLISLPAVITYLALQRYFEDGLVSGSLK
jgi:raffinose/stachyose/melibiose transport system permease protein